MPALPLDDAGSYVAAAYAVFLLLLVVYVGIMAAKLGRISREIGELAEHVERRNASAEEDANTEDDADAEEPVEERERVTAVRSRDRSGQPAPGPQPPTAPIQEERW